MQRMLFWGLICFFFFDTGAFAFSFKEYEAREAEEEAAAVAAEKREIHRLMSAPCLRSVKGKKTVVIIGEKTDDRGWKARQENFGPLFAEINRRLQEAGIRTYDPEEITRQIAQEEIEAFLSDDVDRAVAAAEKLQADFILRGTIHSKVRLNPVAKVNDVSVSMNFVLVDRNGKVLGNIRESNDRFAGVDTLSAAIDLVTEKADLVVAKLYNAYCTKRVKGGGSKASTNKAAGSQKNQIKDF